MVKFSTRKAYKRHQTEQRLISSKLEPKLPPKLKKQRQEENFERLLQQKQSRTTAHKRFFSDRDPNRFDKFVDPMAPLKNERQRVAAIDRKKPSRAQPSGAAKAKAREEAEAMGPPMEPKKRGRAIKNTKGPKAKIVDTESLVFAASSVQGSGMQLRKRRAIEEDSEQMKQWEMTRITGNDIAGMMKNMFGDEVGNEEMKGNEIEKYSYY